MRITPDDEIYHVNAVWLGPPNFTLPWRARYVAWGIGLLTFFLVLTTARAIGVDLGVIMVAWVLVITIVITRLLCRLLSRERPLAAVMLMFWREVTTPRPSTQLHSAIAGTEHLQMCPERPRPAARPRRRGHADTSGSTLRKDSRAP